MEKINFWILIDASTKKRTQPLTEAEMKQLLRGLSFSQIEQMLLWTDGWKEWMPLMDFLSPEEDTFILPKVIDQSLKEAVSDGGLFTKIERDEQKTVDYGYWFQDFHAVNLKESMKAAKAAPPIKITREIERRVAERHDFKIEILIMDVRGKIFKTHSENISLSGTLLHEPVPIELLQGHFELIIINKLEKNPAIARILFKGKIVGDITNPHRLSFVEPGEDMTAKLENMFAAYQRAQEALMKAKKLP